MHIFIDESGTFTYTENPVGWSVVSAIAIPESVMNEAESALNHFKNDNGKLHTDELKLGKIEDELSYFRLLNRLARVNCTTYTIATNAHLNTPNAVSAHKKAAEKGVLVNLNKMRYEGGRQAVLGLAEQISRLPLQLHIQLTCQIRLMYQIISDSVTYYAQREPATLSKFIWRIDAKEPGKQIEFEAAFQKLSPAYLQMMSLSEPMPMVTGFDYSYMTEFLYGPGEGPTYLRDDYGVNVDTDMAFNIGKIIRDDIRFIDSKNSFGVQLADLLSAGMRRCLRGGFNDNLRAAAFLGRMMVQRPKNQYPILLSSLGIESILDEPTAVVVRMMKRQQRPMISRTKAL